MTAPETHPARFPHPSWAWPRGDLDLLLTAIIAPDADRAEAAARAWFQTNAIDIVEFREHRLLLAIISRFGKVLSDLTEYPRLVGLQRMLWTKSRMATREALPPLLKMSEAGLSVMLFKGAARLALHPEDQKSRVSHDIDILVRPSEAARALDILVSGGWTPSSGESTLCLSASLPGLRSINLFFGHFGDIDLHQWGYGSGHASLEARLWDKAQTAKLFDVPVLVPSPEDRLALAIHSSALEAHAHSDWLVDCARILDEDGPNLDLNRTAVNLETLGATVQAEVALGYLCDRIGLPLVDLGAIRGINRSIPAIRRAATLLQAKPRTDWTTTTQLLRAGAKAGRLRRARKPGTGPPVLRGKIARGRAGLPTGLSHMVAERLPSPGHCAFQASFAVLLSGLRRRYEFELNTEGQHIARLRARNLAGRKGWATLTFEGEVELPDAAGPLWIEARPGKTLRGADPEETARYEAVEFACTSAKLSPVGR